MSRKIRKYAFSGMFIVSLVLIMISVSFSWFVNENAMRLWDITAEVEEVQDLLVKDANNAFAKKVDIKYPEDLVLSPVIGNGINFYKPVMTKADSDGDGVYQYEVTSYEKMTAEEISQNVLSFEVSFQVAMDSDLYICINPNSNSRYSYLKKSDRSPESAYGEFSTGYITGALRVAIFHKEDGEYNLKSIWIPDTDTRLMTDNDGSLYIATGNDTKAENFYQFARSYNSSTGSMSYTTIYTHNSKNGVSETNGINYTWGTENDIRICHIEDDGTEELKFVIWIDGADTECHNALVGGIVDMNLMFEVR